MYLTFSSSYPVITGTVPGSPAAAAGLQAGDEIVKVGDKVMKGVTADQAATLIQGPSGAQVTLTIMRGTLEFSVSITRKEIQIPTVRSATIADHILYVRIYQFSSTSGDELHTALKSGLPGAKGIVLNLREDPVGFTPEAVPGVGQLAAGAE